MGPTESRRVAAALLLALLAVGCSGTSSGRSDVDPDAEGMRDIVPDADAKPEIGAVDVPSWDPGVPVLRCFPDVRRCAEPHTPEQCSADGRRWELRTPCAEGSVCHPLTGECGVQCASTDARCVSRLEYLGCDDSGEYISGWCAPDLQCLPGGVCADCLPGDSRCADARTVYTCSEEGGVWAGTYSCGADLRCAPTLGDCVPCGECTGPNTHLDCAADGGEGQERLCPDGTYYCVRGRGCIACLPGALRCLDAARGLSCRDDGSGWDETTPCGAGSICAEDEAGGCAACYPGDARCLDRERVGVCSTGPAETDSCLDGGVCVDGECVAPDCSPEVLLLLDSSASMEGDRWALLQDTVRLLLDTHPSVTFRLALLSGPGVFSPRNWSMSSEQVYFWFGSVMPNSDTPLTAALNRIATNVDHYWPADNAVDRVLIVLTDGAATDCVSTVFPAPQPSSGSPCVDSAAAAVHHLAEEYGIRTYAVAVQPPRLPAVEAMLLAIAQNGRTSLDGFLYADDEESLLRAVGATLSDPKGCR